MVATAIAANGSASGQPQTMKSVPSSAASRPRRLTGSCWKRIRKGQEWIYRSWSISAPSAGRTSSCTASTCSTGTWLGPSYSGTIPISHFRADPGGTHISKVLDDIWALFGQKRKCKYLAQCYQDVTIVLQAVLQAFHL